MLPLRYFYHRKNRRETIEIVLLVCVFYGSWIFQLWGLWGILYSQEFFIKHIMFLLLKTLSSATMFWSREILAPIRVENGNHLNLRETSPKSTKYRAYTIFRCHSSSRGRILCTSVSKIDSFKFKHIQFLRYTLWVDLFICKCFSLLGICKKSSSPSKIKDCLFLRKQIYKKAFFYSKISPY